MPDLVKVLKHKLTDLSLMLVTAESCTGGLIASAITDLPGASSVFERGFVTYSNESKTELLGVEPAIISRYGAVSPQVATEMAKGALKHSLAEIAVSVTGVAGPDGGTDDKPVGRVYIGYGMKGQDIIHTAEHTFSGDRESIRLQAVGAALKHLNKFLDSLA